MPRHHQWRPQSRQSRTWEGLEPLSSQPFSTNELMAKRLELAGEMIQLVLQDGHTLAGTQRRKLQQMYEHLAGWRQGRW